MKIKYVAPLVAIALSLLAQPAFSSTSEERKEDQKSYIARAMEFHKKSMAEKKEMGATDEEMAFFRATSIIGIGTTFIFKKCSSIENSENNYKDCKDGAKDLVMKLVNDMNKEHGLAPLSEE